MAEHRPTYGSRLRAWRRPGQQVECRCGQPWTPEHETEVASMAANPVERGRPWQASDGPIPDGEAPRDFIQTRDGFHQIGDDAITESCKRANRRDRW